MRSVSIVFARSLLPISDSAGGFQSAFALSGPACRAPDGAKRGLGSFNKDMRRRSLTGARPMFRGQGGRGAAGRKRGRRSDRLLMLH